MNFDLFAQLVPKIKNLPLPGEGSHFKMVPPFRAKMMQEQRLRIKNAKKAGVMALFYPNSDKETHLLLILRKTYEGVHSNQIGFPGGKVEKGDSNMIDTALRETYEEVGVPSEAIEVIKALSTVYIPPSNFEVQPYIGLLSAPYPFTLQESEVEAAVEVPLAHFMDDGNVFVQKLSTSYADNVEVPAFNLNGHTVWGATAMMLNEIKELLQRIM